MKRFILLILIALTALPAVVAECRCDSVRLTYKLHGQTRRFDMVFEHGDDGSIRVDWAIERNLRMWHGSYTMSPPAVSSARKISYIMPEDGNHIVLGDDETFAIISREALEDLRKGQMLWASTVYRLDSAADGVLQATDTAEGASITVLDDPDFPLILSMSDNPLEINWTATPL